MTLLLFSCIAKQSETIVFEPRFRDETLSCETPVQGWSLTDFRMFLSKIEVNQNPVELLSEGLWQTKEVGLLDFESGSGSCVNGDSMINAQVKISKSLQQGDILSFDIGVPFEINHSNPVKNKGPLRNMSMHWSWRSGYKFVRLGANNPQGAHWSFHLGSTQCLGEMTDVEKCVYPNRPRVELVIVDPEKPIFLNLDHLLLDTRENADLKWGCMSERDDKGCKKPFEILGIQDSKTSVKKGIVSQ